MASRMCASSSPSMMASTRSKTVFSGARRAVAVPRSRAVRPCFAMVRQWPDREFMAEVASSFPDKGVAEPDEVRCLIAQGWTYMDVRPALEYDEAGKVKGSINMPIKNMVKKMVDGKKTYEKSENTAWMGLVERKFPQKDSKILVGCSDGKSYSIDALMALDDAGYTNIVGVAGGYNNWFRVFDYNMRRRNLGEYQEKYDGDGGDSCGIHASGAGFERSDSVDKWAPAKF